MIVHEINDLNALSILEKEGLYKQVDSFIDLLDERAIKELTSGNRKDIDDIFNVILLETYEILNLKKYNNSLSTLSALPNLKSGYEEYLRKANLNYFVHSVLPSFEMNWHNIEWFNMVQLYRLLCIMAARDHSKSYSFSFAYILWRLYRYMRPTAVFIPPDDIRYYKEGMLITNEFKLAKKLLKKVKEEIQINDVLREALYPEKNLGGWANESLTCKNGAEVTLSSFRTSNRGPHPGWIVIDDFLDKSAIYSKDQREKFTEVLLAEIMNMLLPQGQACMVGCVTLESLILTRQGFCRMGRVSSVSDMNTKSLTLLKKEVLDIDGFTETSNFFVNGFVKTKVITLQRGYRQECSMIHPLRVMSQDGIQRWVVSNELKVGDYIGLKKGSGSDEWGSEFSLVEFKEKQKQYCYNINLLSLPDYLDEDLSYLCGLFIAEGSLYKNGSGLEISTGDREIIDFLFSLKEKYNIIFRESSEFSYVCTSKKLYELFLFLGFTPTHCNLKEIPDILLESSRLVLQNILSGLFDGDGSCSVTSEEKKLYIQLSSTSEKLVYTVQSILLMGWGITSSIGVIPLEKLKESCNKNPNNFNCNFDQYSLNIWFSCAINFCNKIGFRLSRKQNNVKICKKDILNDLIPYQFQWYDLVNKERIKNKIWYNEKKPYFLSGFYSKRSQKRVGKSYFREIVDYYRELGVISQSLDILENNIREDILWLPIRKIEDSQNLTVDFVIPKTNSFITNGFISHNTPFHEKDTYSALKLAPEWRVFEYPAIFPDGSLLWENRYNFSALKSKRLTLGSMIFSREILVRPVSDSTSIFPWTILENAFINMKNYVLVENIQSFPIKFKKVATGIDWALSANVGADFTEITTVGLDELDQIWLLNLTTLHGASYNEQVATVQRINNNFNPDVILAETNGFQKVMAGLCKEAGLTNIVEEVTGNSKKDLYQGLPSLAVIFERGTFKFPRGDEKSIETTNNLCGQLNSISFDEDKGTLEGVGSHDDKAMSLYFAVKALKTISNLLRISMIG